MTTYMAKNEEIKRKWYIADADGAVLGRMAAKIAVVLRGKHKAIYTPHVDTGDFVIVTNAEKVRLTGKKAEKKVYQWHTFYPGGLKEEKFVSMIKRNPEKVIREAVRGMLPKTKLGDALIRKLKIYKGPKHPHTEVTPETLKY